MNTGDLLKRAQKLDVQALGELHDLYYPMIYRYVRYRLDENQIAEDTASEVFLRLLDALKAKPKTIRNLRGWLFGTASHLVNDHYRKKYRHEKVDLEVEDVLAVNLSPEQIVEMQMMKKDVRGAIQRLTEEQQHVLTLRFSQMLSLEDTAQIMSKSVNAVKALQFRAIGALRRKLAERWNR